MSVVGVEGVTVGIGDARNRSTAVASSNGTTSSDSEEATRDAIASPPRERRGAAARAASPARAASQRTTLRAQSMNPIAVAPISVSFWTIHSGRSPFGIALITVAGAARGSDDRLRFDRQSTGRQPCRQPTCRRRR